MPHDNTQNHAGARSPRAAPLPACCDKAGAAQPRKCTGAGPGRARARPNAARAGKAHSPATRTRTRTRARTQERKNARTRTRAHAHARKNARTQERARAHTRAARTPPRPHARLLFLDPSLLFPFGIVKARVAAVGVTARGFRADVARRARHARHLFLLHLGFVPRGLAAGDLFQHHVAVLAVVPAGRSANSVTPASRLGGGRGARARTAARAPRGGSTRCSQRHTLAVLTACRPGAGACGGGIRPRSRAPAGALPSR